MAYLPKFLLVVATGVLALFSAFVFRQPQIAHWLITFCGIGMVIPMLWDMLKRLRDGQYGVDILAITAIIATLLVQEYWASLMILVMLTGGDSLEEYASHQADRELRQLLANVPHHVHRVQDGQLQDIPITQVNIGDHLLVKPKEIVPVDGSVLEGQTYVDESSLTGEAEPIRKKPGDALMSGVTNGDQALTIIAEKKAADSQYQQIIRLVQESKAQPAHFVRMADRYAVPFTLAAYVIAGVAWYVSKEPTRFAEVLVVASPCPLILAAPIALVAGMSRTSRNGIIVKTGTTLEKLARTRTVAFDKTGTLTTGILTVDQIVPASGSTAEELLHLAASAEQGSNHILAQSLLDYVGKNANLATVSQVEEQAGQGVQATIQGHCIKVGKPSFVTKEAIAEQVDQTAIFVAKDGQYMGYISFSDQLRPEAKATVHQLRELAVKDILMVSGDQETVAQHVAKEADIQQVYASCLPQEKVAILKQIPKTKHPVVMVGDGVNDAPSLAVADVGIAMVRDHSTAASEAADAVILKDDLHRVCIAIQIAKETMQIARQSVLIGIFICIILMLVASTGVIPALLGAVLQEVVDTVSIFSALRARRK